MKWEIKLKYLEIYSNGNQVIMDTIKSYLLLILFGLGCGLAVDGQTVYVATTGNDKNAGTKEKPVATFEKAKALVRKLTGEKPVNVVFANGTYYLPQTVKFTHADGKGTSVTYSAAEEGKAILSGGSLLSLKWKPYKDRIFVAEIAGNPIIDQLYINGERQRMARFPNAEMQSAPKKIPVLLGALILSRS